MTRRTVSIASLALALTACGITVTPRAYGSSRADGVDVEYSVWCHGCVVQYTTPTGVRTEEDVGRMRQRYRFHQEHDVGIVSLRAVPNDSSVIESVVIRVNGQEVASSTRVADKHQEGESVRETAALVYW